uniref:Hemagglutinin n=1 Tax=Influenza B virus (B/Nevada/4867/2015) TaxID=1752659 RepID=A0A0S2C5Q6_9INFB|nr:hemagglutinin [Influenza B virus (B/Nevada/4867/2015)]
MKAIIVLLMVVTSNADRICTGITSSNSPHVVKTATQGEVNVTGVIPLTTTPTKSHFANLKGTETRGKLCPKCLNCTDLDVALGRPKCTGKIPSARVSILHEVRPVTSGCFPIMHDRTKIRQLPNLLRGYEHIRLSTHNVINAEDAPGGPYKIGTSGSCPNATNGNGFFATMAWAVPKNDKNKTATNPLTIEVPYICTEGEDQITVWGFHSDNETQMAKLYGDSKPQKFTSSANGVTTHYVSQIGGFPNQTEDGGLPQSGRIVVDYMVQKSGKTGTITYQRGILLPQKVWCASGRSKVIKGSLPLIGEADCLHEKYGGLNKSKPYYTGEHAKAIGNCPIWVKTPLKLANGTKYRPPAKLLKERGFFGAIAGFLEGGWEGMIAGWHGYTSHGAHGVAVAADLKSTQEAINKITKNLNSLSELEVKNLQRLSGAMDELHNEILELDEKVDDLRADTISSQIELAVLLSNEGIINSEDEHLLALERKLKKMLGPSAVEIGNGCFETKHKCNQTCLDRIAAGTFDAGEFSLPTFDSLNITAASLNDDGLDNHTILLYYSTAASSLAVTLMIAIFVVYMVSRDNVSCSICL